MPKHQHTPLPRHARSGRITDPFELAVRRLAYERHARELIAEHGWMVQAVFGDEAGRPDFAYTVGLTAAGKPELIIFGLSAEPATYILNDAARRVADGEPGWEHGRLVPQLLKGGYDPLLVAVDDLEDLALARRFYPDTQVRGALQLVYPDADHRWPWQPGSPNHRMPILGQVPEAFR